MDKPFHSRETYFLQEDSCSLADFRAVVEIETTRDAVPRAEEIARNIPVYDAERVRGLASEPDGRRAILIEWANIFLGGAGVLVLRNGYRDHALIDAVTETFFDIIRQQKRTGLGSGDHFAKPGANNRIWNAHEKLCVASPELFARYAANDMVPLVSEAWLGPNYQVTAQVNSVNPGGAAQTPHRDYHMGFQSIEELRHYPAHIHRLSAMLTLQGAIAHCDMPVESGTTKLLPYSQRYEAGYFAAQMQEYRDYFEQNCVQLALGKGDMLFFNPALFHAAGANVTKDIVRIANLLQVGSGYGRSIETVDRTRMCVTVYPYLHALYRDGALSDADLKNAVACCAEGYPFPTNLDRDPPVGGMAPQSQQALLLQAVKEDWSDKKLREELAIRNYRRMSA